MKKIFCVLIIIVLMLCLLSCEIKTSNEVELPKAEIPKAELPKDNNRINKNVYIWTDEKTGVQYIIYSDRVGYAGMGGITPRLNADGTLYVLTENEETKGK